MSPTSIGGCGRPPDEFRRGIPHVAGLWARTSRCVAHLGVRNVRNGSIVLKKSAVGPDRMRAR